MTVKDIRRLLNTFPHYTASSVYGMAPPMLTNLPDEALEEYLLLIDMVCAELTLPVLDWISRLAFLGKPTGGERSIGIQ